MISKINFTFALKLKCIKNRIDYKNAADYYWFRAIASMLQVFLVKADYLL